MQNIQMANAALAAVDLTQTTKEVALVNLPKTKHFSWSS
jgi:hypothetical protein